MAKTRWRTRHRLRLVAAFLLIHVVYGHDDDLYQISQLSPRSIDSQLPPGVVLQTSHLDNLDFNLEPSANFGEKYDDADNDNIVPEEEEEHEKHVIVARSADFNDREQRSINRDDIPIANNNEIDSELELHNKRKYYDILPTKTLGLDYLYTTDDDILKSEGFGDRLDFKFPGEGSRAPKSRALHSGPQIRATAVQQVFATASPSDQGRQNTEIQNIITGIVKLLNGNVNVQANSQLLRPGRPMASRINNRGPPRISDVPPLPDLYSDTGITPPSLAFYPTKTPPPYPFDRPPHHGVNLPEQIVPPMSHRPGFHRPLPPWQRPRPRPPNRRPNPGLPVYKPLPPYQGIPDIPELEENKPDDVSVNENETNSENNIHIDEKEPLHVTDLPEVSTSKEVVKDTPEVIKEEGTTVSTSSTSSSTSTEPPTTTEKPSTTTEKKIVTTVKETTISTTTEKKRPVAIKETTTETTSTTEKVKTEKPVKIEKKKETIEKDKPEKNKLDKEKTKPIDDKLINNTSNSIQNKIDVINTIQSSKVEDNSGPFYIATPTPTEGLLSYAPTVDVKKTEDVLKTSSINNQPLPTSNIPYHPYRPRPGIVLDDPDFKPSSRRQAEAAVITADPRPQGYGETFAVTVSAIQGPGEKGASVHIETVHPGGEDDIIVTASGEQGFVSIDGKRTYLNLFDTATHVTSVRPTRVQSVMQSAPPQALAPLGSAVAVPDEPPRRPPLRPHGPPHRRPQPTVRIDTCIVGDDSTCDQAQNEMCRTEAGISSCQCRPGYARRVPRAPCRRVVALLLTLRVDRLYDRKVAWDNKLADKESEPYQQLSYEAVRAIDSAFSMTPFSDDFVSGSVNSVHRGDNDNPGVFVNYTVLMLETPETVRAAIGTDVQKHVLGVIRRRSNNVGASALWVDTPAGAVLPLKDLDECASPDLNDCHQLAVCTNTWGGFRCACPDTTLDVRAGEVSRAGRQCQACPASQCNERGVCRYSNSQPHCSCSSGYYGSTCEVDGEVVGVAVGASLAAALVIALTLAALLSWSRKWSREQKAMGMGSPVFSYMTANTVKTPPVGQPPYQVTLEERMRWAQIAEAMAQASHYAPEVQAMATRPSSAMFGGYPTLPPVPMPRMALHSGVHTGTLNTMTSRANTSASHHNLYGYTNHMSADSTSSEASSHAPDRADLLVPRPKSRARSMHNQTGIYYDVEYENAPEGIYGSKGIPLSTYTVSRGPPFYR